MGFRKARLKDQEKLEEISRNAFPNHSDYVENILEKWIGNNLYIYEEDNEILAFCKLSEHSNNIGFLEGIRVKKEHQVKGIGSKLTDYMIKEAAKKGYNKIRFVSHFKNKRSINLGKKSGFKKKESFSLFELGEVKNLENLRNKDYKLEKLKDSHIIKSLDPLKELEKLEDDLNYINYDWKFFPVNEGYLKELNVFGFQNSIFALKFSEKRPEEEIYIPFIIPENLDTFMELINLVKRIFEGYKVIYMLDSWDGKVDHLLKKDFQPKENERETVLLYEKNLN